MSLLIVLISFLLGALVFFASIVSPTVFKSIPLEQGSRFLRSLFPKLFLFGTTISLISSLIAYSVNFAVFILLITSALLFLINRNVLTPKINDYRDKELEGNKEAGKIFSKLHHLSVGLFIVNLALLITSLIILT